MVRLTQEDHKQISLFVNGLESQVGVISVTNSFIDMWKRVEMSINNKRVIIEINMFDAYTILEVSEL